MERADDTTRVDTAAAPRAPLAPGTVVGRYVIVQDLARGGMGTVMLAYDTQLARRVAIKLLLTDETSEEARVRMMREAQAMARLSHPNVVAIYDVGSFEGNIFLTMEYIDGVTLRTWLTTERSWREILDVMKAAGRGLAAAHAAGIVHRDFKPSNVLIGKDGRVCVVDFGIARAETAGEEVPEIASVPVLPPSEPSDVNVVAAASSQSLLVDPITEEGAILGTVGYLAPEQAEGLEADARSDVFSFCAALFRALYKTPPFPCATLMEYLASLTRAPVARPSATKVPAWIHPVLLKGLKRKPEERYASMGEVLSALDDDPERRRKRIALASAGVLGLAALATVAVRAEQRRERVCDGGAQEIGEVWSEAAQGEVERKFLASGAPFAADAWRLTNDALGGYAGRWADAYKRTCEATRVRKEQSEDLMNVRMACLEQDRAEMRALVGLFREADREIVGRAVQASIALPSVEACADIASLMEVKPVPAASKDRVARLRGELAAARAELDAGRYKRVLARVEPLVADAREIGYEPLLAETLYVMGAAQHSSDAPLAAAATLRDAVWAAERGKDERLKLTALIRLASAEVTLGRFEQSALWLDFASASLDRRPGNDSLEARYELGRATRLYIMGKYVEAEPHARKAVAIAERRAAEDPTTLWESYFRLGSVLMSPDGAEGLSYLDRADGVLVARFGEAHPQRIRLAGNRAVALSLLGRNEEAVAVAEKMLALAADVLPANHRWVGILHGRLGFALMKLRRWEEALAALERDASITRASKDDRELGEALAGKGEVLVELGKPATAIPIFDEALAALARSVPSDHDFVANALKGRGIARLAAHQPGKAIEDLDAAVATFGATKQITGNVRLELAEARFALARALAEDHQKTPRIPDLAMSARAGFAESRQSDRVREIDEWLARR